jgi:transposase-like protein
MMIAPVCKHDQTQKFGKDRKGNPHVQCALCGTTWTVAARNPLGEMWIDLTLAEKIIQCLREGVSARATGRLMNVDRQTVLDLKRTCTSHIEWHNLTLRTFIRRMTRLGCGFSKKCPNHESMVALAICHYNFCRVHGTLKTTPAVASDLGNHKWTVREMIERTAGH